MEISSAGLRLIEGFEGYRGTLYKDAVGVETIGYGTTLSAGVVDPLPATCTPAEAEGWLKAYVDKAVAPAINATGATLNQNQFDALCSLGYNLGAGCFNPPYQIAADLRARDLRAVSADFGRYVYAGGSVLEGLVNRRAAERKLFDTPWVDPDPHHYLWFDATPRNLGGGRLGSERALVEEYDRKRKHPVVYVSRLRMLEGLLWALWQRLDGMKQGGADMNLEHRSWRFSQLQGRASGNQVVK